MVKGSVTHATHHAQRTTHDELSAPVWIEVDLAAIQRNLGAIRRFVGSRVKILGVVKANAYGHGLVPVAQALVEGGVDLLAVASVVEGVALRQDGISALILVLGQLLSEEATPVVRHSLIQAIGDSQAADALSQATSDLERPAFVHLKVDTGMGRYGVWHEEAVSLVRRLVQFPGLKMEGVFTHLSMAGQNAEATEEQLARFTQVIQRLSRARLPVGLKHAANSVGLVKFPNSHWDLVRTGLLLYGCSPIKEGGLPFELQPALTLKSRVRFLKTVPTGQTVSYGGTWAAARPAKVATIPVGYAHGYVRALSNRAQVLIRGHRAPVIGRITMEDLMTDVTDIPGVAVGDEVVLIGRQGDHAITAQELATHARTIPYEILAGLSPSIPRRYR
jgi:alanine racemase